MKAAMRKSVSPDSRLHRGRAIIRRTILVCTCLVFCVLSNYAPAAEWRNHTNVNTAHDLLPAGDSVWAATTAGLVLFAGEDVKTLTNAEGLGDNNLLFAALDSAGKLWTGGWAGRLSSLDLQTGDWAHFDFIDRYGRPLRLTAAAVDGDFLWVSSNVGVHKFDTRHFGGEIKETYSRFGDLPADEPVNDVLVAAGHIWVATRAGCAVARTDDINLQDYSRWRSFSSYNSALAADDVAALAEDKGTIFAGTDDGLYAFVVTDGDSTWSRVPSPHSEFYDLFRTPNEILAATASGILSCTTEDCAVLPGEGMIEVKSRAVCQSADGVIWAASYKGEGYSLYDGLTWIDSTVAGIASNTVHDLAMTKGGILWAVHPGRPTSVLSESSWQLVNTYRGGASNALAVDHEGYLWLGGHGTGATRLNPADPENDYQHFDETNSPLRGTEPPPNDWYIVVHDITVDDSGRVWLANAFDYEDRVLVFYDHGCWGYFGTDDGFPPVEPFSLFPLSNELLIGFTDDGLADFELDTTVSLCVGGSQFPQIPQISLFDETDGLPTRLVRCMYVDIARKVWVGTSGGLAYYDPTWRRFRTFALGDIPAPAINALIADGGNNLWVGTDEGLFVVEPGGSVTHYEPENSGLVDRLVTSLAIDENTNTLWVGTAGGISEFIGITESATPVDQIIAYPNPFIISSRKDTLKFDAAYGTAIRIFTAAGELVTDIGTTGKWDGRNQAGKLVASGVYFFVAADAEGNYGRGKFAVLRK